MITRREYLHVGSLSLAGLTLPELLRGRAEAQPPAPAADSSFGQAKSCIVVFLFGAPAHQDIWDLKPLAASQYRGEFQPIASSVPGILVGEHIPRLAKSAHRYAIVRSVAHPDNTHTVAMHYMLTGHRHPQPNTNPRNQPTDFPTFGAVFNYLRRQPGRLPAGISLNSPANQVSANNHIFPGFFAGVIGNRYDPMFIADDPSAAVFRPFPAVPAAETPQFQTRATLRDHVERQYRGLGEVRERRDFELFFERAFNLISSPAARGAFDLTQESRAVRDRYGWNSFGQSLLLARRLVEANVPLVTVNWARNDAYWDTHARNFSQLKNDLLPPFDLGFSALLDDLHQRGLLDETLVVCLGEFGRTPAINRDAGRDHWAACNSVVLAGGGVRGGRIHGASDRIAAYPAATPVSPGDLAATIYHALGVDLDLELRDTLGRPLALANGRPLFPLFG
jgi:Protein of unknown function (DUF1501)